MRHARLAGGRQSRSTTIEGLVATSAGPLQQAWIAEDVPQCGYCQSGQIMAAAVLLREKPKPTDDDIDDGMAGNICRCGTYQRIRKAIHRAAEHASEGRRQMSEIVNLSRRRFLQAVAPSRAAGWSSAFTSRARTAQRRARRPGPGRRSQLERVRAHRQRRHW